MCRAVAMKLPTWAAVLGLLLVLAVVAVEPVLGQEQWPRNEGGEEEEEEGTAAMSSGHKLLRDACGRLCRAPA